MFVRILILVAVLTASCKKFHSFPELNNAPIELPEYVLYAHHIARGKDGACIAVIDVEKDTIVGYRNISVGYEYITDFCLGRDGMLYLALADKKLSFGNVVRVFDPAKGVIIDEITTPPCPQSIYALPNDEALIIHHFFRAGDTAATNTVLDLAKRVVRKKIIANIGFGMQDEVFFSPQNEVWIYTVRDPSALPIPHDKIVKFIPVKDSLADVIFLEDAVGNDTTDCGFAVFVGNEKIYIGCELRRAGSPTGVGIVINEFPSGKLLKFIKTEHFPVDILVLPDNKVYVSHCEAGFEGAGVVDNYITVIDGNTDEILKKVTVCRGPNFMVYSKSLNKVYIGSYYDNCIAVVDPTADTLIKLIKGERLGPWGYDGRLIANK